MAGRPPKTLWSHLRKGTFRPERHAERLLVEPVPPEYEKFAELYRRATSKRQRSAIATDLRRACEKTAGERGPVRIEIDLTPVDL